MPVSQPTLFTSNTSRQAMLHKQLNHKLVEDKDDNISTEAYLKELAPLIQAIKEAGGMRKFEFDGDVENCLLAILSNQTLDDELALTLFKRLCDECDADPWGKNGGVGSLLILALRWQRPHIAAYLIDEAQGKAGLTFLEYQTPDGISALALACEESGHYQGIYLNLGNTTHNPALAKRLQDKIQQLKSQLQEEPEEASTDINSLCDEDPASLRQRHITSLTSNFPPTAPALSMAKPSSFSLRDKFCNLLFGEPETKQHQGKTYHAVSQQEWPAPKKDL